MLEGWATDLHLGDAVGMKWGSGAWSNTIYTSVRCVQVEVNTDASFFLTNVNVAGGRRPLNPSASLSELVKPRPLFRDGVFIVV